MQKPTVEELVAAFCAEAKEKAREGQEKKETEKQESEQYHAERLALVQGLHDEVVRIFKFFIDLNLIEVSPVRVKDNGDIIVRMEQIESDVLVGVSAAVLFGAYKQVSNRERVDAWTYYAYGFAEFKYPYSSTTSRDEFLVRVCQCAGKSLAKYQLR